jgi:uncharacterized protein (DUF885 family)
MTMRYRVLHAAALLLTLSACNRDTPVSETAAPAAPPAATTTATSTQAIDDFFTAFTDQWVEANPNQAISSGYFTGEKQELLEQQLTPLTREYRLARHALARDGLAQLQALDFSAATEVQRQAADVMRWQLEKLLEEEPYLDYTAFPLEQMNGASVSLANQLTVVHPIQNAQDADNYLLRLQQVNERMQEATADSARRAELGIVPPAFIINTTIEQMERFIGAPATANPLVTTLVEKSALLADLSPERRTELAAEAARIVESEVYPAWQTAIDTLRAQLPRATDDAGLWRFANGAEVYAYQLRLYTTTDLTADQIHEIGLQEVARIEAEMDTLLRQVGIADGTINERVAQLKARLAYSDDEAGRASLMSKIDNYLADAQVRSAALFDKVPVTPVIAQPYPEFRWANAAASYTVPPLDGSRPGIFQMPLRPDRLTDFSLRSLVYHETVPGHHFQLALGNENTALPRFMQMRAYGGNSAITEGWALYAERLAAESGWYEGDVEGLIGQLDSALFRARRLVVDTGLHAKGWTRQQAIDYGIEPSEVDRYVVFPGQACSYMIGQLKLVELRERARVALGDKFSIREYHNVVLGAGIVPLIMMETIVDTYIATTLAASPNTAE